MIRLTFFTPTSFMTADTLICSLVVLISILLL